MRISVRSITTSFRRAGLAFTDKPEEIDVDEKTLKVLQAESMLVVQVLPEEPVKEEEKPGEPTNAQLLDELTKLVEENKLKIDIPKKPNKTQLVTLLDEAKKKIG